MSENIEQLLLNMMKKKDTEPGLQTLRNDLSLRNSRKVCMLSVQNRNMLCLAVVKSPMLHPFLTACSLLKQQVNVPIVIDYELYCRYPLNQSTVFDYNAV